MSKLKQFLKVNYKIAVAFILGLVIASTATYAITSVKKYDETSGNSTYCVTGNEATCQSLTPAKTGTYENGIHVYIQMEVEKRTMDVTQEDQ